MDLAVGVIIGAAFQAIVNSLVEDILSPILGLVLRANFSDLSVSLFDGDLVLRYGSFIMAIINFVMVAFVLFLIVRAVNKAKEKLNAEKIAAEKAAAEEAAAAQAAAEAEEKKRAEEVNELLRGILEAVKK